MIHYNFPPLGGVASVRAAKVARYLGEFGWTPVIVAPRGAAYHEDRTLAVPQTKVTRTSSLEWAKTRLRAASSLEPDGDHNLAVRLSGSLRTLVHRVLYVPDAQIGWYPFALRAGRRALREERVDALFSSSPPVSAHCIARRLHLDSGIPWIAEFRDLWTDWRWNGAWRQHIDQWFEQAIVKTATAVITVSPTYASVLSARGARVVRTITNGFDPEDFATGIGARSGVLTYVGTYYPGSQDLGTVLHAFGALKQEGRIPLYRLQIVGDRSPGLARLVDEAGLSDSVDWTGFVSHEESIHRMGASRALLLAGPVISDQPALRGHVAGKAFEYLASGNPIIFTGDLRSDVAEILRPFPQVRMVEQGDLEAAKVALLSLEGSSHAHGMNGIEKFTHRNLSESLARCLGEVAAA
jgi:glycosyltransferase involved in cell wall biosynthesis